MSLNKVELVAGIKSAFLRHCPTDYIDYAGPYVDDIANGIADAVEAFVKSGRVSFQPSEVVGTCPAGGGPLTLGAGSNGKLE